MPFQPDPIHRRFNGAIEQLDDQHDQYRGRQYRALHPVVTQPQGQRQRDACEQQFLAKSRLFAKGSGKPLRAGMEGTHYAANSLQLLPRLTAHQAGGP
jgi:hypothetical protein